MENRKLYEHLNFRSWLRRRNQRLMLCVYTILAYLLLMWLLPPGLMLVLLLFIVPALVWTASYGWREALKQMIRYLQRYQLY